MSRSIVNSHRLKYSVLENECDPDTFRGLFERHARGNLRVEKRSRLNESLIMFSSILLRQNVRKLHFRRTEYIGVLLRDAPFLENKSALSCKICGDGCVRCSLPLESGGFFCFNKIIRKEISLILAAVEIT